MTTQPAIQNQPRKTLWLTATISAGVLVTAAALQIALAAGTPWGGLVWGGSDDGVLGDRLRVASAVAAAVLVWMAAVLLTRGGVIPRTRIVPSRRLTVETWAIAGVMAFNTVGNLASGNPFEQFVAAPLTALVAVLASFLARRGVDTST